jgi:hypothetical protein
MTDHSPLPPPLKRIDLRKWQDMPVPSRRKRGDAPVAYVSTPVKIRADRLGKIWWRGRQWAVTAHGLEALDGSYFIAKNRLAEDLPGYSWPQHMGEKHWVNTDDFVTAWLVAIALHGTAVRPGLARSAVSNSHPSRPGLQT